jgi:phage major head subunit gpT-like protein
MYVNNNTSAAFTTNITGAFYNELENNPAPPWLSKVFKILLSSVPTEIISFVTGIPAMREWLGERRIQSLAAYSVTVTKKDFELTVGVSRDDILFDRFNNIADQIRGMGQAVPRHFVKFFTDLLLGGFTALSYDGQYFFDTDHPNGTGATYSNSTSAALDATSFAAARVASAKVVNNDTAKPLNIRYNWLFYAPGAEAAQLALFGTQRLAGGADNVYFNAIPESQRILLPELGNTAKWFLLDLSQILKPFLLMIVKGLDFVPFDKPSDWIVFAKREYVYGIDTMDNATYFLPELAYGSSVA